MMSANKVYQQSGSSLSFKEWLEREKAKGMFIPNANALEEFNNADGINTITETPEPNNNMAMIRNVAIVGAIIIFGYYIYKKSK
jgi:hypothetical protein